MTGGWFGSKKGVMNEWFRVHNA